MSDWIPFFALLAYLVVAVVLPTAILSLRQGRSAFVFHREANPWQRAMGLGFFALFLGLVGWSLLQGLLGPATLGVWPRPPAIAWLGAGLALAGTAITLAAQRQMGASWRIGIDDRPTALVTHGLYRWVRNPIFSGMLLSLAGFVLACPAWPTVAVWVVMMAGIVVQVRLEERHLAGVHGEAWAAWARRTGRFLPPIGRMCCRAAEPPRRSGDAAPGLRSGKG